jgi:hypothetical protein
VSDHTKSVACIALTAAHGSEAKEWKKTHHVSGRHLCEVRIREDPRTLRVDWGLDCGLDFGWRWRDLFPCAVRLNIPRCQRQAERAESLSPVVYPGGGSTDSVLETLRVNTDELPCGQEEGLRGKKYLRSDGTVGGSTVFD